MIDYFSLTNMEALACNELLRLLRLDILQEDPSVQGFNIGINSGSIVAKQYFIAIFT